MLKSLEIEICVLTNPVGVGKKKFIKSYGNSFILSNMENIVFEKSPWHYLQVELTFIFLIEFIVLLSF